MDFPKNIFKAYDVRGLYPEELNEEIAYKIARAYGQMRQKELGRNDLTIATGRDMRLSSPLLHEAIKRGLTEQGIQAVGLGLCSTPTFYYAVAHYGYNGGLLISASHNPKEYNGVKIVRERGLPFGQGTGMEELMALVEQGNFAPMAKTGEIEEKLGALAEQVKFETQFSKITKINKFKIVADAANSMGALYLEELFKRLPQIELVKMNFELDGSFPAHQPDPLQDKNVVDLKKRVVAEKADLGIATDGDGDRIFFVDNLGATVEPAVLRGIMAQIVLREFPGAVICYDIRPGKITEDMILEAGGVPSLTRVGHSLIKKQMIDTGAVFGGESSGHFFFKFPQGVYEAPVVVILKLLQELSDKNITLADYARPLNKYFHSGEINFKVTDKAEVLAALKEAYGDAEINVLDGFTFIYPDFWFNVRSSNTENLIRLNLEARTKEIMEEKLDEVKKLIE